MELAISFAAAAISVLSFGFALLADVRSRKAEQIKDLLGEKETVAFGAIRLLSDGGLPRRRKHRDVVIKALMQACLFERSDRARALLFRVIHENYEKYPKELTAAADDLEKTYALMDSFAFEDKELNPSSAKLRISAIKKVLGGPLRPSA